MVFQALSRLHARGAIDLSRVVVRLYGRNLAIAERELRGFPELAGSVALGGEVGYQESLVLQRQATVLLLLEWPNRRALGVVTGKIFEYLGAGRPILAIGPRGGEIDRILQMTGRGTLAETVEELETAIVTLYQDFCARGPAPQAASSTSLERFTRRAITGQLADVFNEVVHLRTVTRPASAAPAIEAEVR
jgi:hypothetical protein